MDPQECLSDIIRIIRRTHDTVRSENDLEVDWENLAAAFESLWEWLCRGGYPPFASGPIFGGGPVAIGFPGMSLQSSPRFEKRPITHVRDRRSDWRYAIMTVDPHGKDLSRWEFVSYGNNGASPKRWEFAEAFFCPTCHSLNFDVSATSPLRCSFCEGIGDGQAPVHV